MRLALVFLALATAEASAHETCIEPFRPDAEILADGGFNAEELREEFRIYFSEVEDYLNCLNNSAARIRQERPPPHRTITGFWINTPSNLPVLLSKSRCPPSS